MVVIRGLGCVWCGLGRAKCMRAGGVWERGNVQGGGGFNSGLTSQIDCVDRDWEDYRKGSSQSVRRSASFTCPEARAKDPPDQSTSGRSRSPQELFLPFGFGMGGEMVWMSGSIEVGAHS